MSFRKQLKEDLAAAKTDPEAAKLYEVMVDKLYAMHPSQRQNAWWVMSKSFFDNLRDKFPDFVGDPHVILGKRVVIDNDVAEPRLQAAPEREMIPLEPGGSILYVQCHDADCPANKPGTHHAHAER